MVDLGRRVVFGGIVGGFRGSLDDGMEFEGGRYLNERDMEYFRGHSGRSLVFSGRLETVETYPYPITPTL